MKRSVTAISAFLCLSAMAIGPVAHAGGADVAASAAVGASVQQVGADTFSTITVPFAGGVTGMPDMVYKTVPGYRPLKLDLFLPAGAGQDGKTRPVIVYIHGGGWMGGGPRRSAAFQDWPKVLASIAAQGYVVASVSYRFSGEAPFPAAAKDVKSAIRWLRANGSRFGVDPTRFAAWGQSAGGHLAALVGASCADPAFAEDAPAPARPATVETVPTGAGGVEQASDCVQAVVSWFGIYDLATMPSYLNKDAPPTEPMRRFLGCTGSGCDADRVRQASPIAHVDAKDPPFLLLHGRDDNVVPVAQQDRFASALAAANISVKTRIFDGANHSWIAEKPERTVEVSRQALADTLDFIQTAIGPR
ncbi:MAG: alpha/beta hydrolase fold domain-containing protein [Niveispirillum sp.]|uniref:alpha/beta hydrolase fold domain-containing protein n=1 Tax=Niveispirillum sp. TaxID=1917217 RepID=UPI0040373A43